MNRISRVAGDVINEDQTFGIPTRTIADNLHLIRNVIDYATLKNLSCALVSFDQSKAFDRVAHDYLFKISEAFGFGPSLLAWVRLLYNNIGSRIIVNGHLTNLFVIGRSL